MVTRKKKIAEINPTFFKTTRFPKINKDSANIIRINMIMPVCAHAFSLIVLISD